MGFSYDKLWKKLIDEKMNKLDLQKEADKALAKYNQAIQQYQMAKMRLQRTKPYFKGRKL